MKVEIIERAPTPVVYLRHVGPYGEGLGAFWQETVYPWIAARHRRIRLQIMRSRRSVVRRAEA